MSLTDYQSLVDTLVRDQSGTTTTTDRDRAIGLAVARYSADAPRVLLEDLTWAATGYEGPLPAAWIDGAYIRQAEFPIGEQPMALVEVSVYRDPAGQSLMSAELLAAGSVVRVSYSAPHVLTSTPAAVDTISTDHQEAVASYAAHLLCKQLAAHYSADRETSINADGSNTESRARNYAARARDYRAAYYAGIGKVDPQAPAHGQGSSSAAVAPAASVSAWPARERTRPQMGETSL